jgi:threonine synthase
MQFFSTNNHAISVDFRHATLQGQPPDKGLYFPDCIPKLSKKLLQNIKQLSKEEIAFEVIRPYVGNVIDGASLEKIISETVSFDFPLVPLSSSISTLELFHGPTLAFKDVGARFMSRCLGHFSRNADRQTTVLVATSGDTGGAVADAFHNVANVNVVILYPSGKVSEIQERQLTTQGDNIAALEVEGTFDDCQHMVKEAFADPVVQEQLILTSANSINIARWLPQQFYYFFACQQWQKDEPPVVSVPSGNFGNLSAGLLAYQSGLPVRHFIAACNANDIVSHYLTTGKLVPKPSINTLSNAMDVGNPSNFSRILQLFYHDRQVLKKMMTVYCISDSETVQTLKEVKSKFHYQLDPHGAVGFAALQHYLEQYKDAGGYFLETAHPAKFEVEQLIDEKIELPENIKSILLKEKKKTSIKAGANELKDYLLNRR